MTRSIFYKIKILFSNFKKNKPFFYVYNLLIYKTNCPKLPYNGFGAVCIVFEFNIT